MNSVLDMALQDTQRKAMEPVSDDKIAHVSRLANLQVQLESEVANLENLLKDKKAELRRVQENELPEAMDSVGQQSFKLLDGTKVDVKPYYSASIPSDRKEEAMEWLVENEHDGIIKTTVSVSFGKGQYEHVQDFMTFVRGYNVVSVDPEMSRGVHAQTLKAFVRESVEAGTPPPFDMFGVFVGRKASVKVPK
jgi:hypothetical protein